MEGIYIQPHVWRMGDARVPCTATGTCAQRNVQQQTGNPEPPVSWSDFAWRYIHGEWDPLTVSPPPTHSSIYPGLYTAVDDCGTLTYTAADGSKADLSALIPAVPDENNALGHFLEHNYSRRGLLAVWPMEDRSREVVSHLFSVSDPSDMTSLKRIEHIAQNVTGTCKAAIHIFGQTCPLFYDVNGKEVQQDHAHMMVFGVHDIPDAPSAVAHTLYLRSAKAMVVHDTSRDWRFAKQGRAQFMASVPLISAGVVLGSLTAWGEPRCEFDATETLQELALVAVNELQLILDNEQLKQRNAMKLAVEQFTRHFLYIESSRGHRRGDPSERYDHIYQYAAKTIHDSLDLDGTMIIDLSNFSLLEESRTPPSALGGSLECSQDVIVYSSNSQSDATKTVRSPAEEMEHTDATFAPVTLMASSESLPAPMSRSEPMSYGGIQELCDLLRTSQQGKVYDAGSLMALKKLLPERVQAVLCTPIFGIGRQPFCLVLGYYCKGKHSPILDQASDIALQHVRSMGYMMLYVILKHSVVLADRAKSFFISNMSHELRTPLHGILASTEMLQDTPMDAMQVSFVDTVEACGKGLLELVNHVLDYTKLQGSNSGSKAFVTQSHGDLVKLVQEVCDSSWVGLTGNTQTDSIGSLYAPDGASQPGCTTTSPAPLTQPVELVIDIAQEAAGRVVRFDSGGLRRVMMNLIGNALKFTTAGYVHVLLELLPSTDLGMAIRLCVRDSGCGISAEFQNKKLFQPFLQEDPMRAGTGLGLSIVKTIVETSLNGKIDVWSEQDKGTSITVMCELEEASGPLEGSMYSSALAVEGRYTVHMLGFSEEEPGQAILISSLRTYISKWWQFEVKLHPVGTPIPELTSRDILLINEDPNVLVRVMNESRGYLPPALIATFVRRSEQANVACDAYFAAGGFARVVFKPLGPSRLEVHLDFIVQYLERVSSGDPPPRDAIGPLAPLPTHGSEDNAPLVPLDGLSNMARAPTDAAAVAPEASPDAAPNALAYVEHVIQNDGVVECSLSFKTGTDDSSTAAVQNSRNMTPARSMSYSAPLLENHLVRAPSLSKRSTDKLPKLTPIVTQGDTDMVSSPISETGAVSAAIGAAVNAAVSAATVNSPGALVNVHAITATQGAVGSPLATATLVSVLPADDPDSQGDTPPPPLSGAAEMVMHAASSGDAQNTESLQSSPTSKSMRVLIVDDNAVNRQVLSAYIRKVGLEYSEAADGAQATAMVNDNPADYYCLVVMDLSMPNMDGIAATGEIRRIEKLRENQMATLRHVPIYILSGAASTEDQRYAFAAGADGFLQKPLSFRVFASLIKAITSA